MELNARERAFYNELIELVSFRAGSAEFIVQQLVQKHMTLAHEAGRDARAHEPEFPLAKFSIGDRVEFEVSAEVRPDGTAASAIKLAKICDFVVVGIHLGSDSERRLIAYDISSDPTAAYHNGRIDFRTVREDLLQGKR